MSEDPVHVVTIQHRHGADVIVGKTAEWVTKELAEYVRSWWSDCFDTDMPTDVSDEELIALYFDENPREEWYDHRVLPVGS